MSRRAGDPRGKGTSAWVTAVRERVFHNATEKLLMMCLCDYIDGTDTAYAGPGRTLAPDVGVEARTIKRTLARLESVGVIERVRRQNRDDTKGGRAPDAIRFCWEGFQRLPLVQHELDKMSPKSLGRTVDENDEVVDRMSPNPSGAEDILSPKVDPGIHLWGSSTPPSSFRTPIEPPKSKAVPDEPAPKRRRSSVPEPFVVTAAMRLWAAEHTPSVDPMGEVEQFCDHHRGKGTLAADWESTFRTWMRNAVKFQRPASTVNGHQKPNAAMDAVEVFAHKIASGEWS